MRVIQTITIYLDKYWHVAYCLHASVLIEIPDDYHKVTKLYRAMGINIIIL